MTCERNKRSFKNGNVIHVSCCIKSRDEQKNVNSVLTCLAAPIHVTHNGAPDLRQDEHFEKCSQGRTEGTIIC